MTDKNNRNIDRGWAAGVLFFSIFTSLIIGAILGGISGKYAATAVTEECARLLGNSPLCGSEPRVMLSHLATGVTGGSLFGIFSSVLLLWKLSSRPKISKMAVNMNGHAKPKIEKP
jgi:hypothetical protein